MLSENRTKNPSGTSISVNETLAKGLRARFIAHMKDIESQQLAFQSTSRITTLPTTRKGLRREHIQYRKLLQRVTVFGTDEAIDERFSAWVCWGVVPCQDSIEKVRFASIAHVVDMKGGRSKAIEMPIRFNDHVLERLFQRMGTADMNAVQDELNPMVLWAIVIGIVLRHCEVDPSYVPLRESIPVLFPTQHGAVLGDMLPEHPSISANTFIGGKRQMTDAKQRLMADVQKALTGFPVNEMEELVLRYFILCSFSKSMNQKQAGTLMGIVQRFFEVTHAVARALKKNPYSMHRREDRAVDLGKSDLLWKWAQLQHRSQIEGVVPS